MNKVLAIIITVSIIGLLYAFVSYLRTKEPLDVFAGGFIIFGLIGLLFGFIRIKNEVTA